MIGADEVAIAVDHLVQTGGAERVVLALHEAFPAAPIHTSFHEAGLTYPELGAAEIRASRLNRNPALRRHHRVALPLMPAVMGWTRPSAVVTICATAGWSHGVTLRGGRVLYCFSPPRWLYQREAYLGARPTPVTRVALGLLAPLLSAWDRNAAGRFRGWPAFAISSAVRERMRDHWQLESEVLHAPVTFTPAGPSEPMAIAGGFWLCIARLLPYKNVEPVVRAFAGGSRRLVVVGSGPLLGDLTRIASPQVQLLGRVTDPQLRWLYSQSAGVVAASHEDFGLTPLEANLHGKPAAVLRWGGFLDTVVEGVNGTFFDAPRAAAIHDAVSRAEALTTPANVIVAHAETFSRARFESRLRAAVQEARDLAASKSPNSASKDAAVADQE